MLSFRNTRKEPEAAAGDMVTIGAYWFKRANANAERARRAEQILKRFCDQLDASESEINRLREAQARPVALPQANQTAPVRVRSRLRSQTRRAALS